MGGAASTGTDNDDLIDNLLDNGTFQAKHVEHALRAVDRRKYFPKENWLNAYVDSASRYGNIHISAPSIYAKVLEALDLKYGQSFLNLGSGTGYLSTMVGLVIGNGAKSANHGVECHADVVEYANQKLDEFITQCHSFDLYEFCIPQFIRGNCLKMHTTRRYDRIYCGADCPPDSLPFIQNLLYTGGVAVVPLGSSLLKVTRNADDSFLRESVLAVTFADLLLPEESEEEFEMPDLEVRSLKDMCRQLIRSNIRVKIRVQKGDFEIPRLEKVHNNIIVEDSPHDLSNEQWNRGYEFSGIEFTEYAAVSSSSSASSLQADNLTRSAGGGPTPESPGFRSGHSSDGASSNSSDYSLSKSSSKRRHSDRDDSAKSSASSLGKRLLSCCGAGSSRYTADDDSPSTPMVEQSTVEQSTVEQSTVEQSTVEQSTVEQSTVEQSTVEQSTVEHSTVEQSTVEQSTVGQSTVEQSTVEQFTVEQSTVEQSTAEQSSVQEATAAPSDRDENRITQSVRNSSGSSDSGSSDSGSSDSGRGASQNGEGFGDEQRRAFLQLRRRREVFSLMVGMYEDPTPPHVKRERRNLRAKNAEEAKLYQSNFAINMYENVQSLPLPNPIKKFLLYNRDMSYCTG